MNKTLEQEKILAEIVRLRDTFNEYTHGTRYLQSTDTDLVHFTKNFNVQFFMGGYYEEFFYQDLMEVLEVLEKEFRKNREIEIKNFPIKELCPIDTREKFNQVSHFFAEICVKRNKYEDFNKLRSDTVMLYYETLLCNLFLDIERRVKLNGKIN